MDSLVFASAIPLLNQVNNLLQSRSTIDEARACHAIPRPESVGRGVICWPGGQSLPEGSENYQSTPVDPLLEGSEPPTLLLPEQEGIRGIVSRSGWIKPANAWRQIARMPQRKCWTSGRYLEPWLPAAEKEWHRLSRTLNGLSTAG